METEQEERERGIEREKEKVQQIRRREKGRDWVDGDGREVREGVERFTSTSSQPDTPGVDSPSTSTPEGNFSRIFWEICGGCGLA